MFLKFKKIMFFLALFFFSTSIFAQELEVIELLKPDYKSGRLLMRALKDRKSTRSFKEKGLSLKILSNLLWAAFGVNRPKAGKRTAPSAWNWQEVTIYVAMKNGLFLYNASKHILEPVLDKDIRKHTGIQDFTQEAPVNLIYVVDSSKMAEGTKVDKDLCSAIDTGFISQNVYLYCASEGLATVVLGWVDKPALATLMKLNKKQKIMLTQSVGYAK